jgi:anti-sigma regulatory factor (Ser/Thr protein kinase)
MSDADQVVDLSSAVQCERVQLQIPTRLEWIAPTVEQLANRAVQSGACDEKRARKLSLALHEALTNSVVHGNLGVASSLKEEDDDAFMQALAHRSGDPAYCNRTVGIGVDFDGERCQWVLTDEGDGFDVEHVLRDGEPGEEDLPRSSGRGIMLMRAFMDEVRYEAGGRRVLLSMRRPFKIDQRQNPRIEVRRPVRVGPIRADGSVDWDAAQEGITQDLSEGGIGIFQKELARAHRVLIALDVNGHTRYLPAEVRHCRQAGSGLVELGCRFLTGTAAEATRQADELAAVQEAVTALLRQQSAGLSPAGERREHRRVPYTEHIELTGVTAGDPTTALARDLSHGGIAFLTSAPVAREVKLLTLPVKNRKAVRVRVQVVRCNTVAEGFYDVGACFLGLAES